MKGGGGKSTQTTPGRGRASNPSKHKNRACERARPTRWQGTGVKVGDTGVGEDQDPLPGLKRGRLHPPHGRARGDPVPAAAAERTAAAAPAPATSAAARHRQRRKGIGITSRGVVGSQVGVLQAGVKHVEDGAHQIAGDDHAGSGRPVDGQKPEQQPHHLTAAVRMFMDGWMDCRKRPFNPAFRGKG